MCKKLPYCARYIDSCIMSVISEINADSQYRTLASCCGHGKYATTIVVRDTLHNQNFEWFSKLMIPLRYANDKIRRRFYIKDTHGYYFLPNISIPCVVRKTRREAI